MEWVLYGNDDPNGAMQKLLKRTPISAEVPPSLVLRSRQQVVDEAKILTGAEWDTIFTEAVHLGNRTVALVPLAAVVASLGVLGRTEGGERLLAALGAEPPSSWQAGEGEDEDEEDSAEEEGEEEADRRSELAPTEEFCDPDYHSSDFDDDDNDDGQSGASTSSHANAGAGGAGGAEVNAPVEEAAGAEEQEQHSEDATADGQHQTKMARVSYALTAITPTLERELAAFATWRTDPINHTRQDAKVVDPVTVANDRGDLLRFLGFCQTNLRVAQPTLFGVFGSSRLGDAVEAYIKSLVKAGRLYSTCTGYVAACLAAARFVFSSRHQRGLAPSMEPVTALETLHRQCKQKAVQQTKYKKMPTNKWLSWEDCQRARVAALEKYNAAKSATPLPPKLEMMARDALLLSWLLHQPPDRVGVARLLQYGVTLVPSPSGFDLDLSAPGAHKTAAIFGPSITSVHAMVLPLLKDYIELTGIARAAAQQPYIFYAPAGGKTKQLSPSGWTHMVQACFCRHANVNFSPKDCRSSFITWLKNGDHGDDTLKAAARAMRHSESTQGSVRRDAYDKSKHDRLNAAAVKVAAEFASRFQPAAVAGSSTDNAGASSS